MKKDNNITILLYHGITDAVSIGIENISKKHISKKKFILEMNFIKDNCYPLSMDEIILHYRENKPFPKNSVAVTFDDGFRNNFTIACPILFDYGIPATFYLTTGIIGTDKMFWVDEIETCINRTNKSSVNLRINNKEEIFKINTFEHKIESLIKLKNICKNLDTVKKNKVIYDLIVETNVKPEIVASVNYEKLNWAEVEEMNNNSLFTVGGHNVNHEILSFLPYDDMVFEIHNSVLTLENKLSQKIIHYSYPEGQSNHYNDEVVSVLKGNGIKCCPTAIAGKNYLYDDLFHLKRVMVGINDNNFPFEYFT